MVGSIFLLGAFMCIIPAFGSNEESQINYTDKELVIYLPIGGVLGIIGILCMMLLP